MHKIQSDSTPLGQKVVITITMVKDQFLIIYCWVNHQCVYRSSIRENNASFIGVKKSFRILLVAAGSGSYLLACSHPEVIIPVTKQPKKIMTGHFSTSYINAALLGNNFSTIVSSDARRSKVAESK